MKSFPIVAAGLRCLGVLVLSWGLSTPLAQAGPQQDTEDAEKEFARGDLVASITLWRKAAQQGYAPAQVRLADILDKAEEDAEAAEWYRKAADQGNADGEFGLGQMYLKGEGVQKDLEQARTLILRAAEKNHQGAMMLMMESYQYGRLGLAVDAGKADEWELKLKAVWPNYKRTPDKVPAKANKTGVQ